MANKYERKASKNVSAIGSWFFLAFTNLFFIKKKIIWNKKKRLTKIKREKERKIENM